MPKDSNPIWPFSNASAWASDRQKEGRIWLEMISRRSIQVSQLGERGSGSVTPDSAEMEKAEHRMGVTWLESRWEPEL